MSILIFIASAVIAVFVFHATNKLALTTLVLFGGVLALSSSVALNICFIISIIFCFFIDIQERLT
jgi:hypothetical protein